MLLDWMRLLSSELPMISSAVEKSHQWPQDGQRNNPDGITASLQCPTGSPPAATLRTSSDKLAPRLATHTHTLTVSFYRPIRRNHLTFFTTRSNVLQNLHVYANRLHKRTIWQKLWKPTWCSSIRRTRRELRLWAYQVDWLELLELFYLMELHRTITNRIRLVL